MTEQMQNLRAQRDDLLKKMESLDALKDNAEYASTLDEIDKVENAISARERFEAKAKEMELPEAKPVVDDSKKFKSFAEQLRAVVEASKPHGKIDPRLANAASGMNETTDADGGYAVQSDFIGAILDSAYARSDIMNRVRSYTVGADSNRVNYVLLDDSGDAAQTGVVTAGGVQAYWVDEAGTVTATKPKFKSKELKLRKVMGIAYVTEEMLEDTAFAAQLISDSFGDAVNGLVTSAILNGTGDTGKQPFGILKSNALVTVTPADSTKLTAKDFLSMKAAMRKKDWSNAVWIIHPDLEAELPLLNDGNGNLLFIPAGGLSGAQYDTILGRPIIYDEFASAVNSAGDIILADLSQYMLIRKGQERRDWSMHVRFLYDEQCFRIILRLNGAPINDVQYSVRNSTKKRSPFVALGARTPADDEGGL